MSRQGYRGQYAFSGGAPSLCMLLLGTIVLAGARPVEAQFAAVAANRIQVTDQMLEQWVFGHQVSQQNPMTQMLNSLELQIDLVAECGPLTESQRVKLELAGLGDIHRFVNSFEAFRSTAPVGQITIEEYNELHQRLQPLQLRYKAGLHRPGSLFQKTIRSTLDDEQFATFSEYVAARRKRHYEAIVKATIASIEQQLPLTKRQREKLIQVILEKTEPPEYYGHSYYQYHLVLFQASQVGDAELRPIFLENEWPVFQGLLRQAGGMRQQFRQFQEIQSEE